LYLISVKSLIYIAKHHDRDGGVTVSDLAKFLQVTPATASRLAHYWATNQGDTGHPLVQASIATGDRRRRLLHLTPNGEQFIKGLESALA